ncbi:hypothetical protein PIB30_068439 [Stylosanthes scabra]|uniref:Putative plant transposon protein domain-containing protein n=1 Tax=Stylosanthes scabra TaxID=79078 RepID=A0ABU6ZLM0_9FABA|nr:hypothetical protein [Stylosanthes scabra]
MASSSSVSVFDNHHFKTAFNEELYNTIVKNKKVIAEWCVDLDDDEYPEVREQIPLRGWRRLSVPKQEISIDLIHEFYDNAIITEEEMEEHGGHTYRSFVRGVPIDFSPENIRTVMKFRAQVQGATTDFETRKEHDQQLDRVLADLCMPGATWKLSTGQQRVRNSCDQSHSNPLHNEGWRLRAEDIIADKMVRMAQRIKEKGKLGFPSTIYKLCKEAEYMAELREIKGKQQELYENNDRFYHQVREEQREMAKEIQQVKNYQRQLRDWTRNASGRECYTVWAHQQANPNLVEMSSQKIVKQIYDNIDHKRPMFQGLLKSDLPPSDSAPPPSSSNDPKNPPK